MTKSPDSTSPVCPTMAEAMAALRRRPRTRRPRFLARLNNLLRTAILFSLIIPVSPTPFRTADDQVEPTTATSDTSNGAMGSDFAKAIPTTDPFQFSLIGPADTLTGDGILTVEVPLIPTACTHFRLQQTLEATFAERKDDASFDASMTKIDNIKRQNSRLDNLLWTMDVKDEVHDQCNDAKYDILWPEYHNGVRADFTDARAKRSIAPAILLSGLAKAGGKKLAQRLTKEAFTRAVRQTNIFPTEEEKKDEWLNPLDPANWLSIGGKAISAFLMWATNRRQESTAAYIREMNTRIGQNTIAIRYAIDTIADFSEQLMLRELADAVKDSTNMLHSLANALRDHRLDLGIVDQTEFQSAIADLKTKAKHHGMELRDTSVFALMQMETSHMLERGSGNLNIYLKLPLYTPSLELRIYRFVQAPLPTKKGLLEIDTKFAYLAVTHNPGGSFYGMTEAEFALCTTIQGRFLCPHARRILREDASLSGRDDTRCLFAAFSSDSQAMSRHCRYVPSDNAETMFWLSGDEFLHYSHRRTNLEVICTRQRETTARISIPAGHSIITLQPGCRAQSKAVVFWTIATVWAQAMRASTSAWPQPAIIQQLLDLSAQELQDIVSKQQTLSEATTISTDPATTPAAISAYSLGSLLLFAASAFGWSNRRHALRALQRQGGSPPPATIQAHPAIQDRASATTVANIYPDLTQETIYSNVAFRSNRHSAALAPPGRSTRL